MPRAASLDWSWLLTEIHSDADTIPVLGRCLGAQGVSAVLARMQQALLKQGWVTTRVVAAPQDLSGGVLNVSVVEGYVSAIRFAPEQGQRATLFNTMPVKTGELLNLRDVEQGLENYKRVPTVSADFSIEPGQEPGQSELVIRHSQPFPFRVQASVDDSGSATTGQYQGSIEVRIGLGRGTASQTVWTCDFSHDYVTINADYRSITASKGSHSPRCCASRPLSAMSTT